MQHTVLEKIKSGEVAMKPRWHFVLKGALALAGLALLALALLYTVSFIVFMLHQNGVLFVPMFGMHGLFVFMASSPWLLIALAAVFVVLLELLVCKYSFGYEKPLLYTVLGIVLFTAVGSFVIAQTPIHGKLKQFADEDRLPIIGKLYTGYGEAPLKHVHLCNVTAKEDDGYRAANRHGESLYIVVTERTRLPHTKTFEVGDTILIMGAREGDTVHAIGIKPARKGVLRRIEGQEGKLPFREQWMHDRGNKPPPREW